MRVTFPIRGLKQRDYSSSRLACDRGGHQQSSSELIVGGCALVRLIWLSYY